MMAKLNIWVRDRNCEIIKKWAHLHIFNCRDQEGIIPWTEFTGGHIEVQVPPGCYLVTAGVEGGNIYTDMTMVVVRCGDDACVNLVLNDFKRRQPFPRAEEQQRPLQLIQEGCAGRISIPLIINAAKMGIKREEIQKALGVLYKAANFDERQAIRGIKAEIEVIEAHLKTSPPKDEAELKETQEYLRLLKEYLSTTKLE